MTYTIQPGDTLSKIAADHGTSVPGLIFANQASYPSLAANPNLIQVGWNLTIPVSEVSSRELVPVSAPVEKVSVSRSDKIQAWLRNPFFLGGVALVALGALYFYTKKTKHGLARNPKRTRPPTRTRTPKKAKSRASRKSPQWSIQALRFPKSKFSRKQAMAWARRNKYRLVRVISMKNFWSIEQKVAKHFGKMRTTHLKNGVTAIIGEPKRRSLRRKNMEVTTFDGTPLWI